jgi:hypothetical protein
MTIPRIALPPELSRTEREVPMTKRSSAPFLEALSGRDPLRLLREVYFQCGPAYDWIGLR